MIKVDNKMSNKFHEPVLTIQVDVDSLRNLLLFYGYDGVEPKESKAVYRFALPRFAELFEEFRIRATFFVIGEDLNDEANQQIVRRLHASGHEIASHTQTHNYNFLHLTPQEKRSEIEKAGLAIEKITGRKPEGFRAPGYAVDRGVLQILSDLGYSYDSSIMPSSLNLPFKLFQMLKSRNRNFSGYGSAMLSFAPHHAYYPDLRAIWRSTAKGSLIEIPISCIPYLRLPFYANFNLSTGQMIFKLSSTLIGGRDCNYVFHAVEMLAPSEIDPRIHCHPNACRPLEEKITCCRRFLEQLKKKRRVLLSREFAAELKKGDQNGQDR
jgi:hypothetical protein